MHGLCSIPAPPADPPIERVGSFSCSRRYELQRQIGEGGMAQVFEAVAHGSATFERRVAVKRLFARFASDPAMRSQFLHEAQIASELHHTNIVQVLDYGELADVPLIVLEYVDGIDAAQAVHLRGSMPEPLALHVVAEVAHALHYAHCRHDSSGKALQIVHRDVTPHNVMLCWDGGVKLADFGIALSSRCERRTEVNLIKGKLRYLSPEQLAGEPLTAATDIYALGLTLQALAQGQPPTTRGCSEPRPAAQSAQPIPHPAPGDLAALVSACLAEAPEERPSAVEVARWAGELSLSDLRRDGRGALSAWIAGCRPAGRAGGALDDLLGLPLDPTVGQHRGLTLSAATPSCLPAGPDAKPKADSISRRRLSTWSWVTMTSAIALWVLWLGDLARSNRAESAAAPTAPHRVALVAQPPSDSDGERPVVAQRVESHRAGSEPAAREQAPAASASSRPRPRPASRADQAAPRPSTLGRQARPDSTIRHPRPSATGQVGYLRIGGAALLNATVSIDGVKQARRAPALYRVPLGAHLVEASPPGKSEPALQRRVQVDPGHQRSSPLVLLVRQLQLASRAESRSLGGDGPLVER